jgi:hypothetical protein
MFGKTGLIPYILQLADQASHFFVLHIIDIIKESSHAMFVCDAQEEMHLVWKGHWAWKGWAADKERRMAAIANQPGTVQFEDYKVNGENAAALNGDHNDAKLA